MKIVIIAAIAPGGVIGRSKKRCPSGATYDEECDLCCGTGFVSCNELPWPPRTYPEDMEHFKTVTMGHAVVMGRNTWESIPAKFRPLPGRSNHVVSSHDVGVGAWRCACLADAIIGADEQGHDTLYVIGGSRLYAEALPLAHELDLTLISRKWEGDVKFPFGGGFTPDMDVGSTHRMTSAHHDMTFECVERTPCTTNPDLTFTRWVRR